MALNDRQLVRDHDLEKDYPISNFTSFVDGDLLIYNGASGTWANQPNDGWNLVTGIVPIFRTSGSFIVGGNLTGAFAKGNFLKWTQTTPKYGAVLSVTFTSGTTTTVNIIPNNDYIVENSAITGLSFSRDAHPLGFPDWFNYTSNVTYVPTGTAITPAFSINNFIYSTLGNSCTVQFFLLGTAGVNITTCNVGLPISANPGNQAGYGTLNINAVANSCYSDISSTVLRVNSTAINANRVLGNATYKW